MTAHAMTGSPERHAQALWPGGPRELQLSAVASWMQPVSVTLNEDATIQEVTDAMMASELDHIVIVDDQGELVGVVGYRAIVTLIANGTYGHAASMADLIERGPATTDVSTPLMSALRLLDHATSSCVVVTDRARPVGLLSDKAMAEPSLALVASRL